MKLTPQKILYSERLRRGQAAAESALLEYLNRPVPARLMREDRVAIIAYLTDAMEAAGLKLRDGWRLEVDWVDGLRATLHVIAIDPSGHPRDMIDGFDPRGERE